MTKLKKRPRASKRNPEITWHGEFAGFLVSAHGQKVPSQAGQTSRTALRLVAAAAAAAAAAFAAA